MLSPNWEPFFSNEEIKNFKVRKEIKFLNFDDKCFNGFYKNKYLSKFKNWFIPLINDFLDEYYHGFYCQKIDLSFFKKHAISITNIFYKRLFVLIFDNKKLISNKKMKNIIFKILYFYDRSPLFFNEEYINNLAWWNSNEKKFENNDEIIFKNNPNKKIVLSKLFISILKKHKINIIPSISIENSSYSYKNEIKINSVKGKKLLNISINYLKIIGKLNSEIENNKVIENIENFNFIEDNKLNYLDSSYGYFYIYDMFWRIYKEYGFKKFQNLCSDIVDSEKKINFKHLNSEYNDVRLVRNKLNLLPLPRIIIDTNFGDQTNEEKTHLNMKKCVSLIKEIIDNSLFLNYLSPYNVFKLWCFYDFDWICMMYEKGKIINDPIKKFNSKFVKQIDDIDFNKSKKENKKNDLILSIKEFIAWLQGEIEFILKKYNNGDIIINFRKLINSLPTGDKNKEILHEAWDIRNNYNHSKIEEIDKNLNDLSIKELEEKKRYYIKIKNCIINIKNSLE